MRTRVEPIRSRGFPIIAAAKLDYRGEVRIGLWNRNPPGGAAIVIQPGDGVAQTMSVPVVRVALREVGAFSQGSQRDAGGFGLTGT